MSKRTKAKAAPDRDGKPAGGAEELAMNLLHELKAVECCSACLMRRYVRWLRGSGLDAEAAVAVLEAAEEVELAARKTAIQRLARAERFEELAEAIREPGAFLDHLDAMLGVTKGMLETPDEARAAAGQRDGGRIVH